MTHDYGPGNGWNSLHEIGRAIRRRGYPDSDLSDLAGQHCSGDEGRRDLLAAILDELMKLRHDLRAVSVQACRAEFELQAHRRRVLHASVERDLVELEEKCGPCPKVVRREICERSVRRHYVGAAPYLPEWRVTGWDFELIGDRYEYLGLVTPVGVKGTKLRKEYDRWRRRRKTSKGDSR